MQVHVLVGYVNHDDVKEGFRQGPVRSGEALAKSRPDYNGVPTVPTYTNICFGRGHTKL
jgi:hypothetical protein